MDPKSERQIHRSGGAYEAVAGYARAVRVGPLIAVSGSTAADAQGKSLHPGDLEAQTRESFARALGAVEALGGSVGDVVRTRIFLAPGVDWREATRVHKELFAGIEPANTTLYVAGFVPEGVLVEVEVDAFLVTGL